MKRSQIIAIVFIAACAAMLVGALMDSGKQGNFEQAFAEPGTQFRIAGFLDKSEPVVYDPLTDASKTTFMMKDQNGVRRKVELAKSMPQGFEQSESLVLMGSAQGDVFHAKDMQMKCPSKYNEEQHKLKEASI